MYKKQRGLAQVSVSSIAMLMAMNIQGLMLKSGWGKFSQNLGDFFDKGMTQTGLPAIGLALIGIGLSGAAVFFVIHKLQQQSSLPRPGGFLVVAFVGIILRENDKIINGFIAIRDIIFGWFGL